MPGRKAKRKRKQERNRAALRRESGFCLATRQNLYFLLRLSSFPTERERKLKAHADLARPLNVTQHLIYYKETTMRTDGAHKADAELKSK